MDVTQLLEPVLTGGIKDTHFFNGRVLTADDLRTMQVASREHDAQLGRALGDGVAYGLEVSVASGGPGDATSAVLHVSRGLAVNRLGDRAALGGAADVALVKSTTAEVAEGVFKICIPVTESVKTNLGLYLLTIAPASGLEGRAPMTELGAEGVAGKCGSRYEVEGVAFDCRPVALPSGDAPARIEARALFTTLQTQLPTLAKSAVSPGLYKLRNIAAHLMFGSDVADRDARDPLTSANGDIAGGWLQELRQQKRLTDCEVPLALLHWSIRGIEFVDMWAVRRRLAASPPPSPMLPWLLGARRLADAEARLKQFQDQIETLRNAHSAPQAIVATDYFRYLPSAGLLPLRGPQQKGFDLAAYFSTTKTRSKPAVIEGARLEMLLRESLWFPAVEMQNQELVWLYLVRQNKQPGDDLGADGPQLYAAFARGDMPYFGNAHFDVAHWDYSSYALSCDYTVQTLA
jgi:hypothetical protein